MDKRASLISEVSASEDTPIRFGDKLIADINSNEVYKKPWKISKQVDEATKRWCLSEAVGLHETNMCTNRNSPTANSRNNCWGIMYKGQHRYFDSMEEGREAFLHTWSKGYDDDGLLPTMADAEYYSGRDQSRAWYNNVHKFYNRCIDRQ